MLLLWFFLSHTPQSQQAKIYMFTVMNTILAKSAIVVCLSLNSFNSPFSFNNMSNLKILHPSAFLAPIPLSYPFARAESARLAVWPVLWDTILSQYPHKSHDRLQVKVAFFFLLWNEDQIYNANYCLSDSVDRAILLNIFMEHPKR